VASERRFFGTDGIRGPAGIEPMTAVTALRVGMAVGATFGQRGKVVVGKDTRRSCYMFENAIASGLCAVGCDVMLVGPLPTPAIAYLVHSMRADAGVVISASHNPFADNGIKLFASDGFKLPDELELELEGLMEPGQAEGRAVTGRDIGRASRITAVSGRYIAHAKAAFPDDAELDGLKIVLDCAHGAAYKVAPKVFEELGAEVIAEGVSPNGTNINDGVGALHPDTLARRVRETGADLGLALDGDADRVVACDEHGNVIDGDALLAICGRDLHERGRLQGGAVVSTVMSNLGLERSLAEIGVRLLRTKVGDRYVVEAMRTQGINLGGEQSGHVICLDHGTTGDGIVAGLQLLGVMVRRQRPLSELATVLTRYPQVANSWKVASKIPLADLPKTTAAVRAAEASLGDDGRVVIRYSGTENKLRVMIEGTDETEIRTLVETLGDTAVGEIERAASVA
jgi:phosphoglucosamine mutase